MTDLAQLPLFPALPPAPRVEASPSYSLKQHVSTTLFFPVHHPCFEAAQLSITYLKQQTNFLCIYRPKASKKNKFGKKLSSPLESFNLGLR